jgi:probable phosphoglycerate mutase
MNDPRTPGSSLITLVRHGQTAANTGGVWHGSTDTPLSEHGRGQAARVADHLAKHVDDSGDAVAAIFASPLQRARHTAEAIGRALGIDVEIHPGLGEYDLGRWEGLTYQHLHQEKKLWEHMANDPDYAPHGGESPRAVVDRLCGTLREIERRHRGGHVIAVSHGGAMALALGFLIEGEHGRWKRVMGNCAVTRLELEPRPRLLSFNHVDHLEEA